MSASLEVGAKILDKMPNDSPCPCIPAWLRWLLFFCCLIVGFILSSVAISETKNLVIFYLCWIFGVAGAWLGQLFIKSFKKMFETAKQFKDILASHIIVAICFVICLILVAVVNQKDRVLAIVFFYIICFVALIWLALLMVPCIQKPIRKMFAKWFKKDGKADTSKAAA